MKDRTKDPFKRVADIIYNEDIIRPQNIKKPINISMENKLAKFNRQGRNLIKYSLYLPAHTWADIHTLGEKFGVPPSRIVEVMIDFFNMEQTTDNQWVDLLGVNNECS